MKTQIHTYIYIHEDKHEKHIHTYIHTYIHSCIERMISRTHESRVIKMIKYLFTHHAHPSIRIYHDYALQQSYNENCLLFLFYVLECNLSFLIIVFLFSSSFIYFLSHCRSFLVISYVFPFS